MNNPIRFIYSIARANYIPFLQYSTVGLLNTVVDMGVFSLMYYGVGTQPLPAHICAFICAAINSFIFNSLWTFRNSELRWNRASRFFAVMTIMLGITTLIFWVLKFYLPVLIAKIAVIGIGVFLGYFFTKRFVYR